MGSSPWVPERAGARGVRSGGAADRQAQRWWRDAMKHSSILFFTGFLSLALGSCSRAEVGKAEAQTGDAPATEVHAIVTYRERISLPANAMIELSLSDESVVDTIAAVVASRRIRTDGLQVPLSLALPYRVDRLQPDHDYVLQARVITAGKTIFATADGYRVDGGPAPIEVMLERVSAQGKVNRPLENTEWRLVEIRGVAAVEAADIPTPTLRLTPARREAIGATGCNPFSGSYELRGGSLRFGPLAASDRPCGDTLAEDREIALLDLLRVARGWRVSGDTLVVSGGGKSARFAASR